MNNYRQKGTKYVVFLAYHGIIKYLWEFGDVTQGWGTLKNLCLSQNGHISVIFYILARNVLILHDRLNSLA